MALLAYLSTFGSSRGVDTMFKVHWGRLWEVAGAYSLGLAAKSAAVKKCDEIKDSLLFTRSIVNVPEFF